MKIRLLHFILVFTVVMFVGLSRTQASPVSLGNASRFAALALNGNVSMSGTSSITGPVGVASSGFSFAGVSTFKSDLYVNTGSAINLNGATPSNIFQSTATNSFLSQAITDANNASAAATAKGPGTNLGNISGANNLTNAAVGNYVYTVGNVANSTTINISAPAGSTVIVNITGTVGNNINFQIAGGLTANNVLYNVTGSNAFNQGGGTFITGILLAPNSTVSLTGNAVVTGQVIATGITISNSANINFSGSVVPEPPSLSVLAIGAAVLLGPRLLRKRRNFG